MNKGLEIFGKHWYELQENFFEWFIKLIIAIFIVVIFVMIGKYIKRIGYRFYLKLLKGNLNMASFIASCTYFVIILLGIFIGLEFVGLEKVVTNMLAGAGIVGIVAGFAFKDVASNLFAGMLLKLQDPFKPNDWVEITGIYGQIEEVGWIMTSLQTIPEQKVYIPNQMILNNAFMNYSSYGKKRVILETGVSYGDDLEHVKQVAIDEISKVTGVLSDEIIDFYYVSIGGYSYNFHLRFWIKFQTNDDYLRAMSDAIIHIKKRFEEENISIAYPVTTLDFGVKGGVNIYDKELKVATMSQPGIIPPNTNIGA